MFQMNAFYHGWGLNRQVRKAKSKSQTLFFWRKVALKPPKQYTKLDTQGFLSNHLSSTIRQARSRFVGRENAQPETHKNSCSAIRANALIDTKLDTQGFLSYHLSSTVRQARSRFVGRENAQQKTYKNSCSSTRADALISTSNWIRKYTCLCLCLLPNLFNLFISSQSISIYTYLYYLLNSFGSKITCRTYCISEKKQKINS